MLLVAFIAVAFDADADAVDAVFDTVAVAAAAANDDDDDAVVVIKFIDTSDFWNSKQWTDFFIFFLRKYNKQEADE